MPTSGDSQTTDAGIGSPAKPRTIMHDDAVVEQQREHRDRLLPHRKEAQPRAKAQHDEDHHDEPQRLLAEQLRR